MPARDDLLRHFGVDQFVAADDDFARLRMADRLERVAAFDPVVQILDDFLAVVDLA